jgi:hypothetical protein
MGFLIQGKYAEDATSTHPRHFYLNSDDCSGWRDYIYSALK